MSTHLADEIRQTKPFKSLAEETILNLARTASVLLHEGEQVIRRFGITSTQYNVLRILRGAGAEGLSGTEIRHRLVAQVPDVTRLLDRLENAGLVERRRERTNRRFVTTRITEAGLRLLEEADPVILEEQRVQLAHMTEEQQRTLIELLRLARKPG